MHKGRFAAQAAAVMMAAAMLPQSMITAYAEEADAPTMLTDNMYLGTSIIADPQKGGSGWSGSYVNYGTYNGQAVKYRVLDAETTDYGSKSMLLECDTVLWYCGQGVHTGPDSQCKDRLCSSFYCWLSPTSDLSNYNNDWAQSDLRKELNERFLSDTYFTDVEQAAILESYKSTPFIETNNYAYASLTGERIFILEYTDYYHGDYGYNGPDAKSGGYRGYWVRTKYKAVSPTSALYINNAGWIALNNTNNGYIGVVPAMNIDPSKVLFTTVVDGTAGKADATYELTLVDDDLEVAIAEDTEATRKDNAITIQYTLNGSNKNQAGTVALMILNKQYSATDYDGNVLVYLTAAVNDKGEVTYTLPDDVTIPENAYYYLIAVGNQDDQTGTASAPVQIAVQEEPDEPDQPDQPDTPQDPDRKEAAVETHTKAVCHHKYAWDVVRKGTATTDGLVRYRCQYCGDVEYEVPIAAYYIYNKETQESILQAAPNATVVARTPVFISFHEMVMNALQERPDVTLLVDYRSGGKDYEMTIPAGSGELLENLFGENQYAGYLYLGGAFATVEQ